jgi:superfamily II DNA/RNA helicase
VSTSAPLQDDPVAFASLGLPTELISVLAAEGIVDAFPIQAATMADALAGRDVVASAPTGSGKTLAFGLPSIVRTWRAHPGRPRTLILAPTRELAAQIAADLVPLARAWHRRVFAFHGGVGYEAQVLALDRGVDIAVGCPGRLLDLLDQGELDLGDVRLVVVDEVDRLADMGFLPEVSRLLDATMSARQTLFFSATLSGDVEALIDKYQTDPVRHEVGPSSDDVVHEIWIVDETKRTECCAELVAGAGSAIVFTRTRHGADRLAQRLTRLGVRAVAIHGGRSQVQRERALDAFRRGKVDALVATDVAARGIHVDAVACVVQYDLPADATDFIHRAGRTGRAGAPGLTVTLSTAKGRQRALELARGAGVEAFVRVLTRAPKPTAR